MLPGKPNRMSSIHEPVERLDQNRSLAQLRLAEKADQFCRVSHTSNHALKTEHQRLGQRGMISNRRRWRGTPSALEAGSGQNRPLAGRHGTSRGRCACHDQAAFREGLIGSSDKYA
jgi:hypothetical protein